VSEAVETIRTFVAVPLWDDFAASAKNRFEDLKNRGWPFRWVHPDRWHLTLRFLGDVPKSATALICESISDQVCTQSSFTIEVGELGGFPRLSKARVLWVGVREGRDELCSLAESVTKGCTEAGYPGDKKPFTPHFTIARAKDVPVRIQLEREVFEASWGSQFVDAVHLVGSTLGPGGPTYESLSKIPLAR